MVRKTKHTRLKIKKSLSKVPSKASRTRKVSSRVKRVIDNQPENKKRKFVAPTFATAEHTPTRKRSTRGR